MKPFLMADMVTERASQPDQAMGPSEVSETPSGILNKHDVERIQISPTRDQYRQSEDGRRLLDTIDQLRLLPSINHEIALPQIVVVGQQSSGKSSVLQAISNIDFPTNSGFCTQFATEIICRREPSENTTTTVSIIPCGPIDAQYESRLQTFRQRWVTVQPDQDISDIIEDATRVMGLNTHKRITRDKLRLEISGARQDNISLIDLPGLFEQRLPGQREDDKRLVDEMVKEYISGSQTIILAVVSGAYDLQVQRIFEMFEPYRDRTLGVITAPDLVEMGTARGATFQQLVANASFKAGHEWHVLRNLSHREEMNGEDRDEVERRFFAHRSLSPNDVWASVPESRVGIHNFKAKLAVLLQKSIIDGLPQIQRQLRNALRLCSEELSLLGEERSTPDQQRDYLADRSEKLRTHTTKELNGGNSGESLRSKIRSANDRFADDMHKWGAYWKFGSERDASRRDSSPADPGQVEDPPISISDVDWLQLMRAEISNSRGRELDGTVDPIWIGRMFLRQSRKWRFIAESHTDEVFAIVSQYFDEATDEVVGAEHAPRFLTHAIHPELRRRERALKAKVAELLSPYNTEHIQTLNRTFGVQPKDLSSILAPGTDKRAMVQNTIAHYTSIMLEYYQLALNIFVDNFGSLAVENVLLGGLETVMTATKAHKMSDDELAALASESVEVTGRRQDLRARMHDYQEGSRIIIQFSARGLKRAPQDIRTSQTQQPLQTAAAVSTTPSIVVDSIPADDTQSSTSQDTTSTATVKNQPKETPIKRQIRRLSTGGSSRASSVNSQVFSEAEDSGDGPSSGISSANSTPLKGKSPRRNPFEVHDDQWS